MEERMNDDHVGMQTVNPRRKEKVKPESTEPAIPGAENGIQQKPGKELQEVRTGNGWNFMPNKDAGVRRVGGPGQSKREAFDALRVQMDFAMLIANKPFQQFGKGTLRAMPAINEG